jgi:hypothetical protein
MDPKKWWEAFLIPLTIALVGIIGTYFVTNQQIKSTELVSKAQLESADNHAKSEQQIKLLEIFFNKITSRDKNERETALIILKNLEPELAMKLAQVILEVPSQDPIILQTANEIISQSKKLELCEGKASETISIDGTILIFTVDGFWENGSKVSLKINDTKQSKELSPLKQGESITIFNNFILSVINVKEPCVTIIINKKRS